MKFQIVQSSYNYSGKCIYKALFRMTQMLISRRSDNHVRIIRVQPAVLSVSFKIFGTQNMR